MRRQIGWAGIPWQVAYVKWLADGVKAPDSWTKAELIKAAVQTDFDTEAARSFRGGWESAARYRETPYQLYPEE